MSLLPQVRQSIKVRSCTGLSATTWVLNLVRCLAWAGYGSLADQPVVAWANIAQVPLVLIILASAISGARAQRAAQTRTSTPGSPVAAPATS